MLLALKLLLVPALLGLASAAARRWGHAAGGWVTALPLVAGPIVLIMALEHGPAFGARAAAGTMLGLVYVALFCVVYARLARRFGWLPCLLAGWVQVAVTTTALAQVELSVPASLTLVLGCLAACHGAMPATGEGGPTVPGYLEIGWRMLAGVSMVLVITSLAAWLGPRLSGLTAGFPIGVTVMAVFSHRFHGVHAVIGMLRAVVPGLASFAFFFAVCAASLDALGVWAAFGLGALVCLAVHAALAWWALRRARRSAAPI